MSDKTERWAWERIRELERTIKLLRTHNYKLRLQRDRAKVKRKTAKR